MSLELRDLAQHHKHTFSEVYEVVRTVEVVMDDDKYRIEIVRSCASDETFYAARYLVQRRVILSEEFAEQEGEEPKTEGMDVWVSHTHVWVHQLDPDTALSQALGFLGEGKRK